MKRYWVKTRERIEDDSPEIRRQLIDRIVHDEKVHGVHSSFTRMVESDDHDALIREAREIAKIVIRDNPLKTEEWQLARLFLDKTKESA